MSALPQQRMSVEEYLAWSKAQAGRFELVDGLVYAQAAERAAHAEMKGLVFIALTNAIRKAGTACHALVDGMAVRVGSKTVYEPDVLVYCGAKLPPDALLVENPVIVVEVISPSTGRNDHTRKLPGYFSLASIAHYLIVDPDEPLVIDYWRGADGVLRTATFAQGRISLRPPGLELALDEIYPAA